MMIVALEINYSFDVMLKMFGYRTLNQFGDELHVTDRSIGFEYWVLKAIFLK